MRSPFFFGVGGVLSADIAVPNHERELAFYSSVLTSGDAPLWRDDLANNVGTPIIGLGVRTPEYDHLPLQWMPHFQVANVAASARIAVELGGKEIMHGKSNDGSSQWAVLADQYGAAFGIIPVVAGDSYSADQCTRFGCISWLSLSVADVSASVDFYQRVLGWTSKSSQPPDKNGFEMLVDDDIAAAEIRYKQEANAELPTLWLIHLPVCDLDESLRRVESSGGIVVREVPEEEYAVIKDPIGVYFALQGGR